MSQAEDLLNSLNSRSVSLYTANPDTEEHIVIDENRYITIPDALKRIAVQFDHDIETVTFDCPRYWDGLDMSEMKVYINYMRPDKNRGMYWVNEVVIDEDDTNIMHFNWTISKNVTLVKGNVSFLVCIKKTDADGNEENHWNSELNSDMYISEGLECEESIVSEYPDVITDLLTRMDYVEEIATPDTMQQYVNEFLTTTPELRNITYDYLKEHNPTTAEDMLGYVNEYLTEHPPLFVIGPEKPGVKCLWFNTSGSGDTGENVYVKAVANKPSEQLYAEVDGSDVSDYDFEII